ncbi:AMP-binding protein [Micromonospora sp. WMMA1976]|uniref:AMP-binding protein n=1 Tax=Micromonospora sp. WMMA1976 TaxID=3014995 RepID=UPI00248BE097|nr:AMP-binding protein [Micromonospora sp. WMMA1976]WBC01100.1 AMP-binding protein [Micromonospora sp. WMMA1976]
MPIIESWRKAAELYPTRPALLARSWSATYAEVSDAATAVHDELRGANVRPGDSVIVNLRRGPLWLPALLAVWRAGAVAVPVRDETADAVESVAGRTAAALVLGDGATAVPGWPRGFDVKPLRRSGAAVTATPSHAYAMPTSGSTGRPRYALVSHSTMAAVLTGLRRAIPVAEGERALHTASFSFSSSIRQLFLPLLSGASVTVLEPSGRFDPHRLLETVAEQRITSLDLTPSQLTAVSRWLESTGAPAPTELRRLLVASEPFTPAALRRWRQAVGTDHTVFHLYGQTELGGAVSALRIPDQWTDDGTGRLPLAPPFAPFTALFDNRPEGPGELLVCGLAEQDGYLTEKGLDRSRYLAVAGDRTAMRTGDLFSQSADGTMAYQGRADHEVKILGNRVDMITLEQAMAAVPGVAQAAVLAAPDPAGHQLRIAYTTTGDADPVERIGDVLAEQLGRTAPIPTPVRLPTLPLTTSGKVDRAALLDLLGERDTADEEAGDDEAAALWRRFTHPGSSELDEGKDFFAAGGHSLSMLELLAELKRHHGVRVLPQQFQKDPTLSALRGWVKRQTGTSTMPPTTPSGAASAGTQEPAGDVDASALQRQVWLAEQLTSQTPSPFWIAFDLDVPGDLDLQRLNRAVQLVAARFDVLRAGFHRRGDSLVIVPELVPADRFTVHRDGSADEPLAAGHLTGMTAGGPLLQVGAVAGANGTTIGLRIHHAVVDRTATQILLGALADAYQDPGGFADRPPAPSFLAWVRHHASVVRADKEAAAAYWDRTLPPRAARTALGTPLIERLTVQVPRRPAPHPGTTPHAMWLWAYQRALAAHQIPQPHLIGVDVDLRTHDSQDLVGPCVHTFPAVLDGSALDAENGPGAAMSAIAALLTHRMVPINEVVAPARRPTGDPRQPFFRNNLVYQNRPYPDLSFGDGPARYRRFPTGIAGNTTSLYVRESELGTNVELAWDSRIVPEQIARDVLTDAVDILGLWETPLP